MKRAFLIMGVIATIAMLFGQAATASEPQTPVPTAVLADLGLGGMQAMSDSDGLGVRGMSAEHLGNSVVGALGTRLFLPSGLKDSPLELPKSAGPGIAIAIAAPPIKKIPTPK